MDDYKKMKMEELEQVAGGYDYHSDYEYKQWLNGTNIKCPKCGAESQDVISPLEVSEHTAYFLCRKCREAFKIER